MAEIIQKRKSYVHGKVTQRMFNFRCDNENWEYLQTKENKGRFVNELIAAARKKQ